MDFVSLAPAVGATQLYGIESGDEFLRGADDGQAVFVAASPEDCPDTDPSKGDHHEKKSWQEKAEAFEKAAKKHTKAGNHQEAGNAYRQAACFYKRAADLDKAAEMYDEAASAYKQAGDEDAAKEARQDVRDLRDSMK